MDFITDLPKSEGFDSILVLVNCFTKFSLFIPCLKTCSSNQLANIFIKEVISHYGVPQEVISDQGP